MGLFSKTKPVIPVAPPQPAMPPAIPARTPPAPVITPPDRYPPQLPQVEVMTHVPPALAHYGPIDLDPLPDGIADEIGAESLTVEHMSQMLEQRERRIQVTEQEYMYAIQDRNEFRELLERLGEMIPVKTAETAALLTVINRRLNESYAGEDIANSRLANARMTGDGFQLSNTGWADVRSLMAKIEENRRQHSA